MTKKQKKTLIRIVLAAFFTLLFNLLPITNLPRLILFLGIYLLIGYDVVKKAFLGLINLRLFDENFLMAIATVGAFSLAIYERSGDYNEAVAVMLLYQTGELFQSIAVGKSRKNIAKLMDIRPDYANIERDGELVQVAPDAVEIGTVITVNPGEKIPIDSVIVEGRSSLNTAALTGESLPRSVAVGDEAISGSINIDGVLKMRTVKEFGNSTASKILELVENAAAKKSRSEKFISRFARIYTPVVCLIALLLATLPPILLPLFSVKTTYPVWIYRALTFLVISCPCALVISVPLAFFATIGSASRMGILIKGSGYVESLSKTDCVVFDKTGTLTYGKLGVKEIITDGFDKGRIIEFAAHAEAASSHPIARCIVEAYGKTPDVREVSEVTEIAGKGIVAVYKGSRVAVGNAKIMEHFSIPCPKFDSTDTYLFVAIDNKYVGTVIISDVIKNDAKTAIEELKALGISKTAMLSGDKRKVAECVGKSVGIDEVFSELLPKDKVDALEKIMTDIHGGVAYVGDGINDAPVLARADVGIAMGALGSDAAIEASDTVIMNDEPTQIAGAIRISKRCMNIVKENIVFSIGIKVLCLGLVALGYADMWLGIFADVGVMVLAILNSLRVFLYKK